MFLNAITVPSNLVDAITVASRPVSTIKISSHLLDGSTNSGEEGSLSQRVWDCIDAVAFTIDGVFTPSSYVRTVWWGFYGERMSNDGKHPHIVDQVVRYSMATLAEGVRGSLYMAIYEGLQSFPGF